MNRVPVSIWIVVALLVGLAVFVASVFVENRQETRAIVVPLLILAFGGLVLFTDVREKQKQITTISAIR